MLSLNRLKCFVAVAEELHFGRAAARLFMTQTPLSRQIQLLEESLGVQLLERTSRSVRLTTAGQFFLPEAIRLISQAEQAACAVQRISRGEAGQVTLGCTAVAGYELIPSLLEATSQALSAIDIVLKEMVSVEQVEALAKGAIDLGFVRPLFTQKPLEFQLIRREPLMAALPANHALASRESLTLRNFHAEPFVMYSPSEGKYFHDLIAGMFGSAGVVPRYVQHIDQTHTILALVRAGLGLAIAPSSAQQFQFRNVVFRPLRENSVMAEIYLAWRADLCNPAAVTLRNFVMRHFA